nr:YetF domain-containing protein [Streptomyces sp. 846.5]
MSHDLWVVQVPILEKILRTVLVYALVLLLFRVAGKRGLATLNTFDFVVMFLLSNVVQNAIIGADNSLLGGVIGAVTLVAVNAAINRWVALDERAERLLEGTATTVISDGAFVPDALRRLALRTSEIEHAVRVQNGDSVEEVADARLEPGGQLIVTLKEADQTATHSDIEAIQTRLAAIEELLATLAAQGGKHL